MIPQTHSAAISLLLALLLIFFSPQNFAEPTQRVQEVQKANATAGKAAGKTKTVRVGILAFRPKPETQARWQPLIAYLNHSLPDVNFDLHVYHLSELEDDAIQRKVDFIFTQPSHYVLLTYKNGLTSPLASLVNKEGKFGVSEFGGVIITRSDRDDITSLADLRGKKLAAAAKNSLGAYQMQAFELLKAGVKLPQDAQIIETGQPQDKAIEAVLKGHADAGFVRTGLIESMINQGKLDASQFKLVGAQWNPTFPFLTSTRLYPEWPFAAMPHVEADLARRVATALLVLPHDGELAQRMKIVGFTIPGDYRSIDELLRSLRLPPFDHAPQFTFDDVLQRFQSRIAAGSLIVFLLLSLGVVALTLLNRRLRQERNRVASNEARQRALFRALGEGVLGCDLNARCTFVNPAALSLLGHDEAACLGQDMYLLLHGDHPNAIHHENTSGGTLQSALLGHGTLKGEAVFYRRDGTQFPAAFIVTPMREKEVVTGSVLVFSDISARKAAESRIQRLAFYDELTNLPNRSLMMERLGQTLENAAPNSHQHALILLNIDRFKVINNARGSDTGDALLAAMGDRLAHQLRETDCVARFAADEFAILIARTGDNSAGGTENAEAWVHQFINKLHASMAPPFNLLGESVPIHSSIGATLFPAMEAETPDAILLRAETALRRTKAAGGNQATLFKVDMAETAAQGYRLERELRHAVNRSELRAFLQPQVHADGRLAGAEVLLRWQHPSRGLLPPGLFIPIAEESDLIVELGSWVLAEASHLLANAEMSGLPLRLAVNISPRHFRQSGFVPWVRDLLAASGANPHLLTLEITEGLVIDNLNDVVAKMSELATLGVRLSIDDFGTGYSSLAYLKRLPLHELKIDRAFVSDIATDPDDAALVETFLAIAAHMNLEVVAEGIETATQASFFNAHADLLQQGYFYGRPEAAEAWLARWRISTLASDWQ